MNDKTYHGRSDYYLQQSRYMLLQAISIEIENIKEVMFQDNNADISCYCAKIGTLVSLRAQIKDLIKAP